MTLGSRVVRAGTRGSRLARWQTARVAEALLASGLETEEVVIETVGDRLIDQPLPEIGGKGVFTEALERALRDEEIDFAVHSLKDLPVEPTDGITVGAVLMRADPGDALLSRSGHGLVDLPRGARIGTSSVRREAQLRATRPDLTIVPLRGNVDTRVDKLDRGDYDAIVLAIAGLDRLGLADRITERLGPDVMLPAPGQGALAVQCRTNDVAMGRALAAIDDPAVRAATTAERAFLAALGGGCSAPIAALGHVAGRALRLRGLVASPDGRRVVRVELTGAAADALGMGSELGRYARARGAAELLS
jgi:hydroxymethylbilane synthase